MKVEISSLAIRFPLSEGWSVDLLKGYVLHRGGFVLKGFGPNDSQFQYLIPEVGCVLDIDKMFQDGIVTGVLGKEAWGETRGLSDIDAMKQRNW